MIATGIYKSSAEFNHSLQESGSDLDLIESPQHKIWISKAHEPDKLSADVFPYITSFNDILDSMYLSR